MLGQLAPESGAGGPPAGATGSTAVPEAEDGSPPPQPVEARGRQLYLFPPARPLRERFGAEFFRQLPERPGVYLMCAARDGLLYVGKAKNLRRRLGQYRSANPDRLSRKLRRLLAVVERIYWDECPDEAEALARERRLLLGLRPRFNTVGKYPAPARHLGWRRTEEGLAVGIGPATTGWERRFGGFTRIKPVYTALLRLIWRALHPGGRHHLMPAVLSTGRPPAAWMFCRPGSLADELDRRLLDYLEGRGPELPDWLQGVASPESGFEQKWCEQDAESLREFYERLHRAGQASSLPRQPGQIRALDSAHAGALDGKAWGLPDIGPGADLPQQEPR